VSTAIKTLADTVIANTYARLPVVLTRGEGCQVQDADGRTYLDFVAGIAVCNLGHAHPGLCEALNAQAATLWHVSNLYYTQPQARLAKLLVDHCFADRAFFCNSGAEANEAAIKLARKYFQDRGQNERFRIVSMKQSFHGRTLGAMAATGQDKIKHGFDPLLSGFDYVPFDDATALQGAVNDQTCAVMLEPIQGEGGIRPPAPGYLQAVRDICDAAGILLIYDEIQTGMGRTGKLFAHQHEDVAPDIMTLAKALGNGLPIGAMLASEQVAQTFVPGSHATTFGGSPLVTAVATRVVEELTDGGVCDQGAASGGYFKAQLETLAAKHDVITEVRGRGLMLGMELSIAGKPVLDACLNKGFLINCVQEKVLRFVPPLIVSQAQIDELIACLDDIFAQP
jgi:acetylornithine aminotransferase